MEEVAVTLDLLPGRTLELQDNKFLHWTVPQPVNIRPNNIIGYTTLSGYEK